jgi:D-cysteine desulfhydrase
LAPAAPPLRFSRHAVTVLHDQVGKGYGHNTDSGTEAVDLAGRLADLALDSTYTGKAMAGLIADTRRRPTAGPVLFWSTLSSTDRGPLLERASIAGIHKSLRRLFH